MKPLLFIKEFWKIILLLLSLPVFVYLNIKLKDPDMQKYIINTIYGIIVILLFNQMIIRQELKTRIENQTKKFSQLFPEYLFLRSKGGFSPIIKEKLRDILSLKKKKIIIQAFGINHRSLRENLTDIIERKMCKNIKLEVLLIESSSEAANFRAEMEGREKEEYSHTLKSHRRSWHRVGNQLTKKDKTNTFSFKVVDSLPFYMLRIDDFMIISPYLVGPGGKSYYYTVYNKHDNKEFRKTHTYAFDKHIEYFQKLNEEKANPYKNPPNNKD